MTNKANRYNLSSAEGGVKLGADIRNVMTIIFTRII